MHKPSLIPDFDYDPPTGPLSILYEDAAIIVVDKPAGLLTVPGKLENRQDCLVSRLQAARWDLAPQPDMDLLALWQQLAQIVARPA